MQDSASHRQKFLPGDRVWRLLTDQTGFVTSDEEHDKIVVRLDEDGRWEVWHADEAELIS